MTNGENNEGGKSEKDREFKVPVEISRKVNKKNGDDRREVARNQLIRDLKNS